MVGATDWADLVERAAQVAVAPHAFGGLWERDGGNLDPERREEFRARLRALADQLADTLRTGDLTERRFRAWAVLALLDRPAQRALEVSQRDQTRVLTEAAAAVVTAPARSGPRPGKRPRVAGIAPVARREAILIESIRLFARSGYAAVSLEDIGEATGIAGPSIYHHFDSKLEILVRGLTRTSEALWLELGFALEHTDDPAVAVETLLQSYTRFAHDHTDLVTILLSQARHLPAHERARIGGSYREYVQEWTALLSRIRPELDPAHAAARVELALALVNGVARIRHLRESWSPVDAAVLARAVLGVPDPRTPKEETT